MSKIGKSARTRAEILDAAWALIAERGAGISLAEIAGAVGMTRQSIYVHFGSRGGLLIALVRRADDRADIRRKFMEALAKTEPRTRLKACLAVWCSFVPEIYPVAQDLIRLRAGDSDAAKAWDDRMTELQRVFRSLTRGLHEAGALAPHWTAARAADFLWAGSSVETWGLLTVERGWSAASAADAIIHSMERALLR
ncbi:MAG: TetR/AcrR family transcriptional regulator [Parvibaculum sp.]|uniref:TetR/AcrR family transcriptional regulator n=1 Tax=Parvibaculum sp. TaxID=2024848 RepID=UPI0034A05BE6